MKSRFNTRSLVNTGPRWAAALLCVAVLAWAGAAGAQLPAPGTPWQFDVTGFIQQASLGGPGCVALGGQPAPPVTGALACGTITVNGHVITVPSNTVVMLPANQLTWEELFALAPAPYGLATTPPSTGLALADIPAPLASYEAHVVGNVIGCPAACQYIAGLVNISQQSLNSGAGYITAITQVPTSAMEALPSSTGFETELQIATGNASNPITKVRINDPLASGLTTGRYSVGQSPDKRFTSDPDNPTITAGTGFPHCLYATDVPQCPQANRPPGGAPFLGSFQTLTGTCTTNPCTLDAFGQPIRILPGNGLIIAGGGFPDASVMAPFEVGDYITFAGNLVQDCNVAPCPAGGPTALGPNPFPTTAGATYISAHTITSNIAIFTAPRTVADPTPKDPAYARIDVSLIGTGGLTVLGAAEAVIRTRFEGFSTDPSRQTHLWGIDVPQPPGTDRTWGTIGVDPGPPTGAVKGRWRFRPPCLAFGTVPTKLDKQCVGNLAGSFLPVTREVKATIETPTCSAGSVDPILGIACPALGSLPVPAATTGGANGLTPGQYHAPIGDYIFVENIPGTPVPPAGFEGVPFLAYGGYTSTANTTATGPLNPWPGAGFTPPPPLCVSPTANAGGPYQVGSGLTVPLFGTASGTGATFLWTAPSGTFANATTLNPTFNAPAGITTPTTVIATLTVTSGCGAPSASASANITVNPLTVPTISYTPANPIVSVVGGTVVTLTAHGQDPGGTLKADVTWTQTNAGAPGVPTVVNPNPLLCKGTTAGAVTDCPLQFTTPVLGFGAASITINLAAQATDANGSSAPDATTITVNPPSSTIAITSAEYRTGKQRLIINATENFISPTLVLTLQPYVTTTGTTYNPCSVGSTGCTFTNNGAGLYILDTVGAPKPQCNPTDAALYATPCTLFPLRVKGSDGGDSGLFNLTRIRQ